MHNERGYEGREGGGKKLMEPCQRAQFTVNYV